VPRTQPTEDPSPLAEALSRVGDRWSLLVVAALLDGPRPFNDLRHAVPGIAPNILSGRLKHLERERLVLARAYSTRPARYAYELTAAGADLAGALRLLADWGAGQSGAEAPRHGACGTPMEARWFCPTCGEVVDEQEDADLHAV
jgi:DNA-binding HxlR family transcriptional regulator